jgi:hypothetical protein
MCSKYIICENRQLVLIFCWYIKCFVFSFLSTWIHIAISNLFLLRNRKNRHYSLWIDRISSDLCLKWSRIWDTWIWKMKISNLHLNLNCRIRGEISCSYKKYIYTSLQKNSKYAVFRSLFSTIFRNYSSRLPGNV